MNGRQSVPFRLVEKGFDVWVNNSRGTTYSKEHQTLDVERDKEKYYNFSFHEMGMYDVPAVVNFIKSEV
jgi:hypothetical protein